MGCIVVVVPRELVEGWSMQMNKLDMIEEPRTAVRLGCAVVVKFVR